LLAVRRRRRRLAAAAATNTPRTTLDTTTRNTTAHTQMRVNSEGLGGAATAYILNQP
jgi:hypothetical protein